MQFQSLFDSVCRCFGHEDLEPSSNGSTGSQGIRETSSQMSAKKRTSRLELKDKQWDELFEEKNRSSSKSPSKTTASAKEPVDLTNAHAVAQARLAANPPHRNIQKRKRSAEARDDIFRTKVKDDTTGRGSGGTARSGFSKLWGNPSLALCFATPVRGASEEPEELDLRSVDASDTATLNTCEDTITSTVAFENKYSHITETRPPMPLFNQFKIGDQEDEISTIMKSDSHSSVNMIKLLQQQQQAHKQRRSARNQQGTNDQEMEDVPGVKAVSTSTDSSRDSHRFANQRLSAGSGR